MRHMIVVLCVMFVFAAQLQNKIIYVKMVIKQWKLTTQKDIAFRLLYIFLFRNFILLYMKQKKISLVFQWWQTHTHTRNRKHLWIVWNLIHFCGWMAFFWKSYSQILNLFICVCVPYIRKAKISFFVVQTTTPRYYFNCQLLRINSILNWVLSSFTVFFGNYWSIIMGFHLDRLSIYKK